ncbi:MAG: helix-turn-helix domain-containing protein, partial [Propionibacteriaceae bacterium]|nr:helix-turn-helix domain-containing protein [Propionibacteriaceae bacterium]
GWPMDAFLRRCGDAGVAAVVFRPGPLDRGSRSVAERLGLSVLLSRDPWRLSVLVHEALHSPVDTQIGALTKALVAALSNAGADLEGLLQAASQVAGREFLLLDAKGRGLFQEVAWPKNDQAVLELPLSKSTVSFNAVLPSGVRLIARRVELTGRDVWLGLTLPGGDAQAAEVMTCGLAVVQAAAAQRLASMQMIHERDSRTRAALLSEVLEAGLEPSEDLLRRTLAAGWDLRGWHVGLRLIALGEGATISLRDDLLAAFAEQGLQLRAVEQTDGWMAWLSFAIDPTRAIERISASIRRAQRAFQSVLPTAIGVGGLAPGAAGFVKSLGQATDAARIAVTRPASGHFVHIDRLGLAQLLLALTHTDVFTPAAQGLLDPLGDPDGTLVTTLATWLDSGGSQQETAAILGIHRNTVAQRMAHITKLLAVDLDDPETRLALHLACRAVKVST